MLKFNNTNIFTGYLKQLLASFNLPIYHVYTKENQQYHDWAVKERARLNKEQIKALPPLEKNIFMSVEKLDDNGVNIYPENLKYFIYIKDEQLQYYIKDTIDQEPHWKVLNKQYYFNKKDLNYTKTFKIQNNIYDNYTHEYLGNYLRFLRDFNNLDLMSLYNCFTDKLCPYLDIEIKQYINVEVDGVKKSIENIVKFDTKDTNYKIYMLPVKFFKDYTIAIDCDSPVEMCCGFYGQYQDTRTKFAYISAPTYKKFNHIQFSQPVLYSQLFSQEVTNNIVNTEDYGQNEKNLKLFIKLPANNKSSITVLEGNYLNYNDTCYYLNMETNTWSKYLNHCVTNYAKNILVEDKTSGQLVPAPDISERPFKPISELQLLKMNTGISYPFADRLIEYLSGNIINSEETIMDNIKRAQAVMDLNGISFDIEGAWDSKIRPIIYDNAISNALNNYTTSTDILGYIDKESESNYIGYKRIKDIFKYTTSTQNNKVKTIITGANKDVKKLDINQEFASSDEIIINSGAFKTCPELTNIILPKSCTEIGENAFYVYSDKDNHNKYTLKYIHYTGTHKEWEIFKDKQNKQIKDLLNSGAITVYFETKAKLEPKYLGKKAYSIANIDIYPDIYKDSKN